MLFFFLLFIVAVDHRCFALPRFALLAPAAFSLVLTDAAPPTLLAVTALSPVMADLAPPTLLAVTALSPVMADLAPSTLLAVLASSQCSQMPTPPHTPRLHCCVLVFACAHRICPTHTPCTGCVCASAHRSQQRLHTPYTCCVLTPMNAGRRLSCCKSSDSFFLSDSARSPGVCWWQCRLRLR